MQAVNKDFFFDIIQKLKMDKSGQLTNLVLMYKISPKNPLADVDFLFFLCII